MDGNRVRQNTFFFGLTLPLILLFRCTLADDDYYVDDDDYDNTNAFFWLMVIPSSILFLCCFCACDKAKKDDDEDGNAPPPSLNIQNANRNAATRETVSLTPIRPAAPPYGYVDNRQSCTIELHTTSAHLMEPIPPPMNSEDPPSYYSLFPR